MLTAGETRRFYSCSLSLDQKRLMFQYQRDSHAAAWTQDYVFQQLIPYIGNKRKLLGLLQKAIEYTGISPEDSVFLDIFAGSGVVARMAKRLGFQVIANDWEPYAFELNNCYIGINSPPVFHAFGGYERALQLLNNLEPLEDWITRHLCPDDDVFYDVDRDRMFYTRSNGMRLDAMRAQIEAWDLDGLLNPLEKSCLLAPLIYQASYTSNTSGVFKAFHNGWGGQTGTALYRILSQARLQSAVFHNNHQPNSVFRMDCQHLVQLLADQQQQVDIAYLDPPYNQHPYGSNYHVLNSIALWDRPALTEKIEGRNKSAIRDDWKMDRRSAYNYRGEASRAYCTLLETLQATHILTSYSTDGMIPLETMVAACIGKGHTEVICRPYKRYRVSAQRFSSKPLTVEFVLMVNTAERHHGLSTEGMCEHIRMAEETALSAHPESAFELTGG